MGKRRRRGRPSSAATHEVPRERLGIANCNPCTAPPTAKSTALWTAVTATPRVAAATATPRVAAASATAAGETASPWVAAATASARLTPLAPGSSRQPAAAARAAAGATQLAPAETARGVYGGLRGALHRAHHSGQPSNVPPARRQCTRRRELVKGAAEDGIALGADRLRRRARRRRRRRHRRGILPRAAAAAARAAASASAARAGRRRRR